MEEELLQHGCITRVGGFPGRFMVNKACFRSSCEVDGYCKKNEREKHLRGINQACMQQKRVKKWNTCSAYQSQKEDSANIYLDVLYNHSLPPLEVPKCLTVQQFLEIENSEAT